jgi:outer membrane receptor protein involved in Fe transport
MATLSFISSRHAREFNKRSIIVLKGGLTMKPLKRVMAPILLLAIAIAGPLWSGTTGKIAGTVTDKGTGERLPGANIVVVGTTLGAASDQNGQYTILEVPPGTYNVQISFIGYRRIIISDVRVYIDQTARVDVTLEEEAVQLGDAVIVAERPLVKPDVATSVVAVSGEELKALPVVNVTDVMGMQAGINNNRIRGVGLDQALFLVDGVTMRDPRNNQALTKVALSTVREISVERGGFNAEYGQVQSGIVNVITNEGKRKGYSGGLNIRMTPPARKYFNGPGMPDVNDPTSFWLRPYFDPDVCWTGTTNGAWDIYTQSKYLVFEGWNAVSNRLCTDNDPNNDLTPLGAQRVFQYQTRKKQINDQPDYEIDGGFGGPVPFISEPLGNLRFFASYRGQKNLLLWPTTRPDYKDYDARLVLNSDISPSMKLRISGLTGNISTLENNFAPVSYPQFPNDFASTGLGTGGYALINMFSDWAYSLADIKHTSLSAKLTHVLRPKTYYEVSMEYFRRRYEAYAPALRDTSQKFEVIPGYFSTSAPYGVFYGIDGIVGGLNEGNQEALGRDNSTVSAFTIKADLTSQINFSNLVKAGVEFGYNDLALDYGYIQMQTGGSQYSRRTIMRNFPIRAAAYLQDKLETKEFIFNPGLRLDYSNSRTDWWTLDPYNPYFYSNRYNLVTHPLVTTPGKGQWQLSPRLGISHPITENSKLFFNYGHFKQMPQYETAYRFDRTADNSLSNAGNPNIILAKTISYELGYDHQLFDGELLVQLAAFYRDITDQQNTTTYNPIGGTAYTVTTSTAYSDIRGFELTLRKSPGSWFYGFLNYTYQATSNGNFGENYMFEDPKRQQDYDENTVNIYQTRSVPAPFARTNLNFSTPPDFGPSLQGHHILGDVLANLLLRWSAGGWTTYNPNNAGTLNITNSTSNKIQNNVQYLDYFDATLRASKYIKIKPVTFQIYADISNLFNTKRLNNTGDLNYRKSLHLPRSEAYNNIPGNDKFGDYRKSGVEWQPIENGVDLNSAPSSNRAWYYDPATATYWQYTNDASIPNVRDRWSQVDQNKLNQVLKDKAYIDLPNPSTYWFLNPRNITFGLQAFFNLD